ncbi:MAG TPA: hypothetical protein VFX12_15785 [Vicinamibacterales bacterium]|nr:hypothetical protein [Vicinamibacterales bacterium]
MAQAFEEWLAFVAAQLPQPVVQDEAPDGSTYFTGGEPVEVIVRLTRTTITVWEHAVDWESPQHSVVRPIRAGSIAWRLVSNSHAFSAARALIDAARESRLSKYLPCSHCGQKKPPESMHDDEICQSCAQRDLGIVY